MDPPITKTLEILIHQATNIHNICIYDNQDVYAKFSLTSNPDHTLSTHIVNGGGKNPQFNQNLTMKIPSNKDSILKCEIWMLSRAPNFMEDQLLGFALVPISQISDKDKTTKDYNLSSTDLFHSPAGTVKLTLFLNNRATTTTLSLSPSSSSSIEEEEEEVCLDYSRIEFPDINIVNENQKMVSEYFHGGAFLHLGARPIASSSEDVSCKKVGEVVKEGSVGLDLSEMEAEQSAMQKQIVDMYMRSMQQFTESLANMKLPMDLDGVVEDKLEAEKIKKQDGTRVFYGSRAFFWSIQVNYCKLVGVFLLLSDSFLMLIMFGC